MITISRKMQVYESKTHIFFKPIFQAYFRLKSLIQCKIMESSSRFMLCRNLKKKKQNVAKKQQKRVLYRKRAML